VALKSPKACPVTGAGAVTSTGAGFESVGMIVSPSEAPTGLKKVSTALPLTRAKPIVICLPDAVSRT
jgi:hypothetical protein